MTTREEETGKFLLERLNSLLDELVAAVDGDLVQAELVEEWIRNSPSPERPGREWLVHDTAQTLAIGLICEAHGYPVSDHDDGGRIGDGSGCSFCAKALGEVTRSFTGPGVRICDECLELFQENPDIARTSRSPARPRKLWRRR